MKEQINQQLQGLIVTIRKFITRVNGDDYTVGLTKEIKDLLKSIDSNADSKDIKDEHFDKLVKICMEVCEKMEKATEYMSNINIRYTSDHKVQTLYHLKKNYQKILLTNHLRLVRLDQV